MKMIYCISAIILVLAVCSAHTPMFTVADAVRAQEKRQCCDGIDNDNDGRVDVYDPKCAGQNDNDESR